LAGDGLPQQQRQRLPQATECRPVGGDHCPCNRIQKNSPSPAYWKDDYGLTGKKMKRINPFYKYFYLVFRV
jgi:hypothetical protein